MDAAAPAQAAWRARTRPAALPSWVPLLGITVLAAALRLAFLGQRSVWLDEAVVVWVAQHPWRDIPRLLAASDQHPPAYFLLMHAWQGLAGTSEAALRLPSAGFGAASVMLTYVVARRITSEATSLLSALVVAISPFHLMSTQEARMYPLLGVLCLASTIALATAVEQGGGGRRWALYAAVSAAMVYTHYLGVLMLVSQGIWVAGWERRHLGGWLAGAAAVALAYVPWMPSFLAQLRHVHSFAWYHGRVLGTGIGDLLGLLSFGGSRWGMGTYFAPGTAALPAQGVILLPFLCLLWRGGVALAANRRSLALVGLPPVIVAGGMLAYSSLGRSMFVPRWFSFLTPFAAVFIAQGIAEVAGRVPFRRSLAAALVGVLLLYAGPVLLRYYGDPAFQSFNWRTAAATVRQMARPGDAMVFVGPQASLPFTYYFRERYPAVDATSAQWAPAGPGLVRLTARHPRLWIIAAVPFPDSARERLLGDLGRAYHVAGLRNFAGAIVYLLSSRP